jgi:hypothetical protein
VVPSGAPSGHKLINCVARVGSRSGSTVGYNLLRMEEQWVRPTVCAPVTTKANQTCIRRAYLQAVDSEYVTLGKKKILTSKF